MGQLHDRMAQDLVLRNLSPATRRNYLLYCRKFAAFCRCSPAELGEADIRKFLVHCIEVQRLSYAAYRRSMPPSSSSTPSPCNAPGRSAASPAPRIG